LLLYASRLLTGRGIIAQKYKQYNKIRDILAGKIPPPPSDPVEAIHGRQQQHQKQQQRKRTQSDAAFPPQTPSKRSKPDHALQKTQQTHPEDMSAATRTPSAAHVGTPSSNRTSFTPLAAVPTSISPTPQRDGRVLGIFDLLGRTPSRPTAAVTKTNILPIAATPSKQRATDLFPAATTTTTTITTPSTARFAATTPQSKRTAQLLFQPSASATTPHRRRRGSRGSITDEDGGKENNATLFKTPSTNRVSKTRANNTTAATPTSSTPSFLRRRTIQMGTATATGLARVDEQDEHGSGAGQGGEGDGDGDEDGEGKWGRVGPLKLPRKLGGLGRSLSSVVAGLRRIQDEAFEEEEDVLREMEMEMEGGGGGAGATRKGAGRKDAAAEEVEVGDSQVPVQLGRDLPSKATQQGNDAAADTPAPLLSAFDEEALYDSPDEDKQRQPLRQFKKRGQKRSTRLVNMRPTRARRPAQTEGEPDEDEEVNLVPETQFDASKPTTTTTADGDADDLRLSDLDSAPEADFHASDFDEEEDEQVKAKAKAKKSKAAAAKDKKAAKSGAEAKGEGVVKRAVRKVKATAHANFKRLKLRNSGSKGGPAHNSRFRRRR
jgi:hypothetical protein